MLWISHPLDNHEKKRMPERLMNIVRNTVMGQNTRFYLKHTNEKDYK